MKLVGLPATVNVDSTRETQTALERILQALRAVEQELTKLDARIRILENRP